jgi:hypothetical protein
MRVPRSSRVCIQSWKINMSQTCYIGLYANFLAHQTTLLLKFSNAFDDLFLLKIMH